MKVIIPWKKKRAEELGNIMFKAHTEMGLPIDVVKRVVFKVENKRNEELFNKIKEDVEWRIKS